MLKLERHNYILTELKQKGRILVKELTDQLNVTDDTIRKDLRELSEKELIKRVHGGALNVLDKNIDFEYRSEYDIDIKTKMARLAIPYIENCNVVFIDGGTTNLKLAEMLPSSWEGRVITNSPPIALALCQFPKIDIHLLGGELNKKSRVNLGSSTINELANMHADLCILGVSSIEITHGITVPLYEEALIKREFIKNSFECLAMITAEKIQRVSTYYVSDTQDLDYIITEETENKAFIDELSYKGSKIIMGDQIIE